MTSKTYIGDTGTALVLDCGQDISTATARSIEVRKPDGTTASLAAVASGTNSIRFDTLAGTLDQAGKWRLQAKVTLPSGVWRGATAELVVYAAFG
jgi:hypothetical protein